MEPHGGKHGLLWWILIYCTAIIGVHSALVSLLLLSWPDASTIAVWDVYIGLGVSGIGSLFAGIITITIGWETTRNFGEQSTSDLVKHFRDALSTTLNSVEDFHRTATDFLTAASQTGENAVVMCLPGQLLERPSTMRDALINALVDRFVKDLPTIIHVQVEGLAVKAAPLPELARHAVKAQNFESSYAERKALFIPGLVHQDALIVVLRRTQANAPFAVGESAFAFDTGDLSNARYAGIRSEVKTDFGLQLLARFCSNISEPIGLYSRESVSVDSMLGGQLTGIPVTRSIITSQILKATATLEPLAHQATEKSYPILVVAPQDIKAKMEFRHTQRMFLPPLTAGDQHSGSVITSLLANPAELSIVGKAIWEVGCGPGYVTVQLASQVSGSTIYATDSDESAVSIAKENVSKLPGVANVHFSTDDCLKQALELPGNAEQGVLVQFKEGGNRLVQMIFVELPLLAYRGTRQLSECEQPYLEKAESDWDKLLPPTIYGLLKRLADLGKPRGVTVVLPYIHDGVNGTALVNEVEEVVRPASGVVKHLRSNGYMRVLAIEF